MSNDSSVFVQQNETNESKWENDTTIRKSGKHLEYFIPMECHVQPTFLINYFYKWLLRHETVWLVPQTSCCGGGGSGGQLAQMGII